jgi:hypothetical protein
MPKSPKAPRLIRASNGYYNVAYWNGRRTQIVTLKTRDPERARRAFLAYRDGASFCASPANQSEKDWARRAYRLWRSAKWRGKGCSITSTDILNVIVSQNYCCAVSGLPLSFEAGTRAKRNPWSASLDRIDTTRGYEPDNIRIVATLINIAMNTWGEEPLYRAAAAITYNRLSPVSYEQSRQRADSTLSASDDKSLM